MRDAQDTIFLVTNRIKRSLDSVVIKNLLTDHTWIDKWYIHMYMRNPRIYCVYKIHRPNSSDQRHYIGVTHFKGRNNPKNRFSCHGRSDYLVGRFIRKYPDVIIEVIAKNLTKKEAYSLEREMVPATDKKRKALNLLNETEGGNIPPRFSELSKSKQEQLRKTRSANAKRLMRDPKRKENIRNKQMKVGLIQDPNGKIHSFKGIQEFALKHGLDYTCLGRVLSGERQSHKGWTKPS